MVAWRWCRTLARAVGPDRQSIDPIIADFLAHVRAVLIDQLASLVDDQIVSQRARAVSGTRFTRASSMMG